MAIPEFRDPRAALEAFALAVRDAATREEYERLIEAWSARGFPELRAYRDNHRHRGEVIAQAMKTMRALDGDDRALTEAERDRLPVLALAQDPPTDAAARQLPDNWAGRGWGGPRGDYGVPILDDAPERTENMLGDRPGRFVVRENPEADDSPPESAEPWVGWDATRRNADYIEQAARDHDVDPDLVRAIMWVETAHFARGGWDSLADYAGVSTSSLPMNIQREKWAGLIGAQPDELKDRQRNIEAGAALLRRIADRVEDPTPERIGSVWNYAGREQVSDYGAQVGRVYREKPWRGKRPWQPISGGPQP